MTFLLLLAACGRNTAPVDETVGSADTGAAFEKGEVAQLARHSGRPHLPRHYAYYDADGDGYGDPADRHLSAWLPNGYSWMGGDCDDADAAVNPGAAELPDGVDNDCDGVVDIPADTGDTGDTAADTGNVDTGDSAPTDTATGDTAVVDTADSGDSATDTGTATVPGIVVSRDTSGGLTYPATLYAWYGSGGSASQSVASASEQLVFSPSMADLSDHAWIDIQAAWNSGADWSDDCDGFSVESDDHAVALYEKSGTGTGDTCRIYTDLAVPSGSDVGVWTLVP